MIEKSEGRHAVPPVFPCGCKAIRDRTKETSQNSLMLLSDGSRICSCGRRWISEWTEVLRNDKRRRQ